jgi:hypothetical protein
MAFDLSQFTDYMLDQEYTDVDSSGKWQLTWTLGVSADGRIVIRKLKIAERLTEADYRDGKWRDIVMRRVPSGGITTRLLHSLRLEPLRKFAAADIVRSSQGSKLPSGMKPAREQPETTRRRGRPELLKASFYREVAQRWHELVESRDPHPDKTLAREFKRSRSNIAGVIRRCRDKGLIPSTTINAPAGD